LGCRGSGTSRVRPRELAKSGEVSSIALLNASGEIVASPALRLIRNQRDDAKGRTLRPQKRHFREPGRSRRQRAAEGETNPPTIVLPRRDPAADRPRRGEIPSALRRHQRKRVTNIVLARREAGPREEDTTPSRAGTNSADPEPDHGGIADAAFSRKGRPGEEEVHPASGVRAG
jgi:hypothetical protein